MEVEPGDKNIQNSSKFYSCAESLRGRLSSTFIAKSWPHVPPEQQRPRKLAVQPAVQRNPAVQPVLQSSQLCKFLCNRSLAYMGAYFAKHSANYYSANRPGLFLTKANTSFLKRLKEPQIMRRYSQRLLRWVKKCSPGSTTSNLTNGVATCFHDAQGRGTYGQIKNGAWFQSKSRLADARYLLY